MPKLLSKKLKKRKLHQKKLHQQKPVRKKTHPKYIKYRSHLNVVSPLEELTKFLHIPAQSNAIPYNKKPLLGLLVQKQSKIVVESTTFSKKKKYYSIQHQNLKHLGTLKKGQVVLGYSVQSKIIIIKILGNPYKDLTIFTKMALSLHQIPESFSKKTLQIADKILLDRTSSEKRQDLSHLPFVTIDGYDAKDFDDAVYASPSLNNSYDLFVSIADVSYYIDPFDFHNPLNIEALIRGNSTYFSNTVFPMLPPILSNHLCSLNPNEKKATITVHIKVTDDNIQLIDIKRTWIQSQARLTYEEVESYLIHKHFINNKENKSITDDNIINKESEKILEKIGIPKLAPPSNDNQNQYPIMDKTIPALFNTYTILNRNRKKRHTIELNIPAYTITFDAKRILGINSKKQGTSHKMIEEFMIAANYIVAYSIKKQPYSLFRFHDHPNPDNIYKNFIESLLKFKFPSPIKRKSIIQAQQKAKPLKLQSIIDYFILRMQSTAIYAPNKADQQSHYALGLEYYTHFTSPIRRYSDLCVHRVLLATLSKEKLPTIQHTYLSLLTHALNFLERKSMIAEKTEQEFLVAYILDQHIGMIMHVRIVSIIAAGLFLQPFLPINFFLPMEKLPTEYFSIDTIQQIIIGKQHTLKIGDIIKIKIDKVSIITRNIQVSLCVS